MKEFIVILIWLLKISVHNEAAFKTSYSPVIYYTEDACKIEEQKINKVASKHLNTQCVMTCEGWEFGLDKGCAKAKQKYRLKRLRLGQESKP